MARVTIYMSQADWHIAKQLQRDGNLWVENDQVIQGAPQMRDTLLVYMDIPVQRENDLIDSINDQLRKGREA